MKNVFLILTILFSANSFAKESAPPPKTLDMSGYYLLKTNVRENDGYLDNDNDAKIQCLRILAENKMEMLSAVESTCSNVIFKSTIAKRQKETGMAFAKMYYSDTFQIATETYCKPRSFSDAAIMSLFKKCQESPQQECFNPKLIEQLNKVKPTAVKEIDDGDCDYKYVNTEFR